MFVEMMEAVPDGIVTLIGKVIATNTYSITSYCNKYIQHHKLLQQIHTAPQVIATNTYSITSYCKKIHKHHKLLQQIHTAPQVIAKNT